MRVPTYMKFYQQMSTLNKQYERISKYQTQISSGKKLTKSSDDPILANRIRQTESSIAKLESYGNSQTIAINRLSLMQSSIQTSVGTLQKVMEQVKAAQNDVASNSDRKNIAEQLRGCLSVLLDQANTKDTNGEYIYAGISGANPPFAINSGSYSYSGSYENSRIPINDTSNVLYNQIGQLVYGGIKLGNGDFTMRLDSGNTGSVEAADGNIVDQAAYVEDTYTVAFVTNSDGNVAVTVTGATSGQLIPPPPATIPNDAPDYQDGGSVNFNGIELHLKGAPVDGDSLTIAPATKGNVFDSLQQLIDTLSSDVNTDTEKANLHQVLHELSGTLSSALSNVIQHQTEIGANLQNAESIVSFNEDSVKNMQFMLGHLGDADLYEVTSALTQETASLQLTQQSYLQVRQTMQKLLEFLS